VRAGDGDAVALPVRAACHLPGDGNAARWRWRLALATHARPRRGDGALARAVPCLPPAVARRARQREDPVTVNGSCGGRDLCGGRATAGFKRTSAENSPA
jgi:hypothetical protein